jgi:DNA mismatch endonuclease, patch repair protein
MRANRKRDTGPELRLRSVLHRRGLRFRVQAALNVGGRSVRPDIVFPAKKVAIFVDGCYWHRCAQHGTSPQSNQAYWGSKLDRNVLRDREVDRLLAFDQWSVVRIWEHVPPDEAAQIVEQALFSSLRSRLRVATVTSNG